MGVDHNAVSRIEAYLNASLRRILLDTSLESRESADCLLVRLVQDLRYEPDTLAAKPETRELMRKLQGVVIALAGGLVVTSNALIGAGAIPVTGGLSVGARRCLVRSGQIL
jgi:hypothetical protein